jgi:hypothetical protein
MPGKHGLILQACMQVTKPHPSKSGQPGVIIVQPMPCQRMKHSAVVETGKDTELVPAKLCLARTHRDVQ